MFAENIAAPSHSRAAECSRRQSVLPGNAESKDASRFENLKVIKLLNKAKFSVYLTCSQTTNQQYAMKAFPLDNDRPHRYFQNEIRFACLDHTNVIKIEHIENKKKVIHKGCQVEMSYILMEYAPYGDFYDLVSDDRMKNDTKLVRTYFRQLVQGLEYLHSQGVSHLDLKLENILLGENYTLKIADFDLSHQSGDKQTLARGTKCYRAPELMTGRCANFSAADIYSAGIILFIMKSGGLMPHSENTLVKGINFYELLYTDNQTFWNKHYQFQTPGQEVFEPDFKELFNLMTKYKPGERADMGQIKASQWYNGEFYTNEELACVMKSFEKS